MDRTPIIVGPQEAFNWESAPRAMLVGPTMGVAPSLWPMGLLVVGRPPYNYISSSSLKSIVTMGEGGIKTIMSQLETLEDTDWLNYKILRLPYNSFCCLSKCKLLLDMSDNIIFVQRLVSISFVGPLKK